ncbi:MAG: glycosyltransferase [Candidatus Sungbacteria bacterium]|nr:glycosyltransferase [Candidatus Sungbacteria bacterium]
MQKQTIDTGTVSGTKSPQKPLRGYFRGGKLVWEREAPKWLVSLFPFLAHPHASEAKGIDYTNTRDFLFLPEIFSAKRHLYPETISFFIALAVGLGLTLYLLKLISGLSVITLVSGIIAAFYFCLMMFKLYVVYKSIATPFLDFTKEEIAALRNEDLPVYTILIPLYREEKVIRQILDAMTAIDYPAEKLDIIITLEEYDRPTIEAIRTESPPAHFKTLILPDVKPKTKPKALNVAFKNVTGEFLVIYDAEIIPDPDQLKKAVLAFRRHPEVACLQPRLDHYNTNQNILTKLFNAEFSFYYDLFLPGLWRLGFPIPLSGHSTHVRTDVLKRVGAWDPYNVTEDCDLGMRFYRGGFKTAIINSLSREEATPTLKAWIMQRTRWMKGFIQTSIVHLRHPLRTKNEFGGWKNFFAFLLTVPGTVAVNISNLLYWLMLAAWVATHAKVIQVFFPTPILYVSVTSFILGNLIFTYLNLIGLYQRGKYQAVKYSALSPLYWIILATATVRAAIQIVTKPHHWEKTTHGTHLAPKS